MPPFFGSEVLRIASVCPTDIDVTISAIYRLSRTKRAGLGGRAGREHIGGTFYSSPSRFFDQTPSTSDPSRSHHRSGSIHTRHHHHRRQLGREHGRMPELWPPVAVCAQHLPAPAAGSAVVGPCRRDPSSRAAVPLPRPGLCPS